MEKIITTTNNGATMTLDTLVGIGSTHLDDISSYTYEILKSFNLNLITIEASPGIQTIRPRGWKIPQIAPGVVKIRKVAKNIGENNYFINDQLFISLLSNDGPNAALEYALQSGIPVYFIDNPLKDEKTIVGIHKTQTNQYQYTKLKLPPPIGKLASNKNDRGFDSRNKFMTRAIIFLADIYKAKAVAHVGGNSHFTYAWHSPTGIVDNFSSTTIQELVSPKHFYHYQKPLRIRIL